jgi:hypothetical protein
METGLDELDRLLFGDQQDVSAEARRDKGFRAGEVVLIRGEPGSGKTTLALQIASHLHRKEKSSGIRYVSLEESRLKETRHYDFCTQEFMDFVDFQGRDELEEMIGGALKSDLPRPVRKAIRALANNAIKLASLPQVVSAALRDHKIAVLAPMVTAFVLTVAVAHLRRKTEKHDFPRLIVIDSLGALMNVLTKLLPHEKPRLLFNEFCRLLRDDPSSPHSAFKERPKLADEIGPVPPVVIIIGEHHFSGSDADRFFPESFFCDVEIVLRPEPIRVPRDATTTDRISLGYHLAATVEDNAQHLETRSFCRVVKSRHSRNQSRRCAYDIEPGRGIRFFETFPGDGKLMLFAENEQQRSAWGSFIKRDLTDSYPALRHEMFEMAGMETVYESSRRLLQVPLRTDMFLSSLDSYWVLGYREYYLKTQINKALCALMPGRWAETLGASADSSRSLVSSWVCAQYPRFVNALVHHALCRLEREVLRKTRDNLEKLPRPARRRRQNAAEKRLSLLRDRIAVLDHDLQASSADVCERYGWLVSTVLGDKLKIADLLENNTVLPRNDLRETFLRPLPRSKLILYGQYNADLIPFLAREDMHQIESGEDFWMCVPYDANIGIFVVRRDLLASALTDAAQDLPRYLETYRQLKDGERSILALAKVEIDKLVLPDFRTDIEQAKARIDARIKECEQELTDGPGPTPSDPAHLEERLTWDQVICLSAQQKAHFGIETRSFDTLMATFLEIVANCGQELKIDARYRVRDFPNVVVPLLRALHYFRALFATLKTPADQTLDPALYHEGPGGLKGYGHWLFARYWYSTLIDALTATGPSRAGAADEKTASRTFIWQGGAERPQLEIVQMPRGASSKAHYTCSGEWSFALLAGSENVALACDLISNLMGSLKVTERGRHGACLPTVAQFYKRHEAEPCVPRTIRPDMDLPRMTFGTLGETYLGVSTHPEVTADEGAPARPEETTNHKHEVTGIFRQSIFDYRHCAREIFGELLRLTENRPDEKDDERVVRAFINMMRGIDDLGARYIFIREPFRQDASTVGVQDLDGRELWTHKRAREPRLHVGGEREVTVTWANHAKKRSTKRSLEDISRGGCCFSGEPNADWKDGLQIKLDGISRPGDLTKKATDNRTHVKFSQPLSPAEFAGVLRALDLG